MSGEHTRNLGTCRGGDLGADRLEAEGRERADRGGRREARGRWGTLGGHYLAILQVGSETILSADHRADPDLVPAGPPHVG